ncbi:hypothetical protein QQZ08_002704 [Neonectria magnoliae]|uniref:Uncharacterized protein n=1 Tax=Neonectria magnoliae TaxID=2732573 RepID=A0ABR1IAU7_9HYPO
MAFRQLKTFALFLVFACVLTPAVASDKPHWTRRDPCPTKIVAVFPTDVPFGTHDAIHEAMKICSNITELDLSPAGHSCEHPVLRWNLPFALDGSDRYLSSLRVLALEAYDFDDVEWQEIAASRPHWSNEDGSWPVSSSSSPSIVLATEIFYHARWWIERAQYYLARFFDPMNYSPWELDKAPRWYKWSSVPIAQRSKGNMELWLDAMDFSQVHTLSIKEYYSLKPKGHDLLHRLPAALPSLRSLTIRGRWVDWKTELEMWEAAPGPLPKNKWKTPRRPRAGDFILALPASSLTNLIWTDSETCDAYVFDVVLQHHGASLRQLAWTNAELEIDPRPTLSMDQLRSLGRWAPELTSLTIDLNRENQDWPREKLKSLARSLPKLTHLTINLNLHTTDGKNSISESNLQKNIPSKPESLTRPFLNAESVREMLHLLLESQTSKNLETVTFREGNWEGPELGAGRIGEGWIEGVRAWVTCRIPGPDELRNESDSWCRAGFNSEYGEHLEEQVHR